MECGLSKSEMDAAVDQLVKKMGRDRFKKLQGEQEWISAGKLTISEQNPLY